jgi:hypothetical protein
MIPSQNPWNRPIWNTPENPVTQPKRGSAESVT